MKSHYVTKRRPWPKPTAERKQVPEVREMIRRYRRLRKDLDSLEMTLGIVWVPSLVRKVKKIKDMGFWELENLCHDFKNVKKKFVKRRYRVLRDLGREEIEKEMLVDISEGNTAKQVMSLRSAIVRLIKEIELGCKELKKEIELSS